MAIELKPINSPLRTSSSVTPQQITDLITLISSSTTSMIVLPEGKSFADVSRFSLNILPGGSGVLDVTFK